MEPKMRSVLFITISVLFSVSIVGGFLVFRFLENTDGDEHTMEIQEENTQEATKKFRVIEYIVEQGDTWENIIKKLDISWELGLSLLEASEEEHNLASIHVGNELRFSFDESVGKLVGVEYDIDDKTFLAIEAVAQEPYVYDREYMVQIKEIFYDVETMIKKGIIESSLFETAQQGGDSGEYYYGISGHTGVGC